MAVVRCLHRQCVVCTPQARSVHRRHQGYVCHIPHSRISRLETNCTASPSSTRVCSEVTPDTPQVSVQSSVAPHSTSVMQITLHSSALRVETSCCHSARFNCPPFNRQSIRPAVAQSLSHHLNRHKTTYQLLVVVSVLNVPVVRRTVVQVLLSDPLLSRSTAAKWRADSTVVRRLYQCSITGTKDSQRTANQTRTLTSGTLTLTVYTHLPRRLRS